MSVSTDFSGVPVKVTITNLSATNSFSGYYWRTYQTLTLNPGDSVILRVEKSAELSYYLSLANPGVSVVSEAIDESTDPDPEPTPISVTGVSLNKTTLDLDVDGTETLEATIVPEDATNKSVLWSSSDEEVATVSSAGLVTAIGEGEATITVTTVDGEKTDTCTVTVSVSEQT